MGAHGLIPPTVVSRLRDARDHARWVPDPGYAIVRDALFDQDPARIAILGSPVDRPGGVTFGEIQQTVRRVAGALHARGISPGDRVAMYLDPSQAAAEVVCGVLAAGAVLLPIPRLMGGPAVAHRLADAGATVLVTDAAGAERVREIAGGTILTVDSSSAADLLAEARDAEPVEPYQPAADEPALLMYTSGTSGSPKGIAHANRVLLGHSGVDFAFELFQADDVYYGTADWGWIGGLMLGLLVPWSFGVPVVAVRQQHFDPGATLATFERFSVSVAFLPPSVLRLLAAHDQRPSRRLRAVVTGGEPAGAAELAWARRHLAAAVNQAFGQTEANALIGDSAVLGPRPFEPGPLDDGSDSGMGAPYPGHVIGLLDDAGEEVAGNEVGEIALGLPDPVAMLGVWSAELGRPVPTGGRWHRTGDLARRAHGHRLEYLGRCDDVIKSRGYRIGPGEIEQALKLHPAVADAAAVGVADPAIGQRIKAFVQLRGSALDAELAGELRELVATTVGPHARPREIESIDHLPRTETGKLLRRDLSPPREGRK